ncbi:MAG TPA: ShlB/FhaC/HecB family hemolysin secretion/activation protein, partial [Steroidobacteraceae bacterium]|nr:ShlB/FhaC/HecB family hemolysin secretion/activation protein [Steroidobacteraceae bacterium]
TSTIESPAGYPPFTLEYNAAWYGGGTTGQRAVALPAGRSNTSLDLSLSFLIRGLGTDWRQFADKRAGADPSYIILHPSLTRQQVLPASFSLVGRIDGQIASGPLINNEQFAAGGADSVRGYTEAERLGDNGVHGSLELRTPQLAPKGWSGVEQLYLLMFAEAAELRTLDPLPRQQATFTLASAGFGLRFKADGLAIDLDGARILRDGYVTESGRYRGLVRFNYSY